MPGRGAPVRPLRVPGFLPLGRQVWAAVPHLAGSRCSRQGRSAFPGIHSGCRKQSPALLGFPS